MIKALGYDVYPGTKRRIASSPVTIISAVLWGMSRIRSFRELLATGRAECCELVYEMAAASAKLQGRLEAAAILAMKPA